MDEADARPNEKCRHPREVDNVFIRLAGTSGHVHHAQRTAQVRKHNRRHGHTTLVRPAEDLRRFAILAHVQQRAGANVDAAVDSRQARHEDEGIDEVHASLPARRLDGNGHGALERLARGADEALGVGRARQAKEEGRAHVDEEDAPKDLANGPRDGDAWVFGLGGGDGDGFAAGIKGAAKDKDGGDAAEAGGEGARVVPVPEAEGRDAGDAARGIDDGEEEEGDEAAQLEEGEPEFCLAKGLDAEELETEKDKLGGGY